MKTVFIFLCFLMGLSLKAQPSIEWQRAYGGSWQDDSTRLVPTSDGGYLICGRSTTADGDITTFNGGCDYWAIKTNSIGAIEWQKSIGGSAYDALTAAKQTSDGGYLLLGLSFSDDGDMTGSLFGIDLYVFKLTATGTIAWKKVIGSSGDDVAYAIEETSDGGYIVTGDTDAGDGDVNATIHGNSDAWVFKLDAAGQVLWSKTYGGYYDERMTDIKATPDGGYIVAGCSYSADGDVTSNYGNADVWIFKINSAGVLQWQKNYGSTGYDIAYDIELTADGGYILAGYSGAGNGDVTVYHGGAHDGWALKLSDTGSIEWQKSIGGTGFEDLLAVKQTPEGDYIFLGHTDSNDIDVSGNHGNYDLWLVKLNNTGTEIIWQKTFGGSIDERSHDLHLTADGGCILLGETSSDDGDVSGLHGFIDIWLVKLSTVLATNVVNPVAAPWVYPNPFSDTLAVATAANFNQQPYVIYDANGKAVLSGMLQDATETIDTQCLPTGNYMLQLTGFKSAVKLIKR